MGTQVSIRGLGLSIGAGFRGNGGLELREGGKAAFVVLGHSGGSEQDDGISYT